MNRVRLIVPFHTQRPEVVGADGLTDLDNDNDRAQANAEAFARYAVDDSTEAAKLIAAAEVLGFRCNYDSGDPHNDDEVGIVTISLTGIAE